MTKIFIKIYNWLEYESVYSSIAEFIYNVLNKFMNRKINSLLACNVHTCSVCINGVLDVTNILCSKFLHRTSTAELGYNRLYKRPTRRCSYYIQRSDSRYIFMYDIDVDAVYSDY